MTQSVKFKASDYELIDFEGFIWALRSYGLKINYEYIFDEYSFDYSSATVEVELPETAEIIRKMSRFAGRPSKGIDLPYGSIFNYETTCREFLEWLETHTAEEAMANLGLSRSTYFRRLKKIREQVKREDEDNSARVAEGREPTECKLIFIK